MEITDVPKALALKYAQFVDDRQFDRMREIMVNEFTQEGPGFHSGSLDEFIGSLHILDQYTATFHLVGNQTGEWHNEIYTGETWSVASHIYQQEGALRKLDMGIRYRDVIEEESGAFKYMSRDLHIVWRQDLPCQG